MEQRVRSLRLEELNDDQKVAWDDFVQNGPMQGVVNENTSLTAIAGVLLHNPGVYQSNSDSAALLLNNAGIAPRERELITLRVAWRCQAKVAWSNHTGHAHALGMSPEEVERITVGPDAEGWSASDRALLKMVDELHDTATMSDETWAELAKVYDVPQLVSLPMFVGLYTQICYTFNALGAPEADPSRGGLSAR